MLTTGIMGYGITDYPTQNQPVNSRDQDNTNTIKDTYNRNSSRDGLFDKSLNALKGMHRAFKSAPTTVKTLVRSGVPFLGLVGAHWAFDSGLLSQAATANIGIACGLAVCGALAVSLGEATKGMW